MRLFPFILFATSFAWAGGPLFNHKDKYINQEFDNAYQDIANPSITRGNAQTLVISSATITSLTVGSLTTASTLGKVRQIVTFVDENSFSTTNTAFQTTNLQATITPTSASNKVFVIASTQMQASPSSAASAIASIFRGTTNLGHTTAGMVQAFNDTGGIIIGMPATMSVLDSPATTSATTYSVKLRVSSAGTVYCPPGAQHQSIVLIEVEP